MYSNGIISIKYTIGIIKLIKVFNASSSLYSCIPIYIVSYSIQNPATARTISSNLCTFSYSSSRSAITFIITIIVVIGIITNSTHMLKVNVLITNSKTIVNFKLSFKRTRNCCFFTGSECKRRYAWCTGIWYVWCGCIGGR